MSEQPASQSRPPIVAIMGHVDHGKSSLLDFIRKSNIVAGEAGGITQHLSAYEVVHKDEEGINRKITFIDTPGHQAFSDMRHRGARVADIAILIVSAEDGVKEQTVEAIKTILENKVPFIVAINKIDRPNANPEKVKTGLLEHGVYVEGYGGNIPYALISAKVGTGVPELLDLILLVADMDPITCDPSTRATGFVIESHLDEKRGVSATLIIKNGTLSKGQFITVGGSMTGTRILENFTYRSVDRASCSDPVHIVGFDKTPSVGTAFETWDSKKDAELAASQWKDLEREIASENINFIPTENQKVIPIIIKSDALGTADALEQEINKLSDDRVYFKVIKKSVGTINESDMNLGLSDRNSIIIGFHVGIDSMIKDRPEMSLITVKIFTVIYKMSEWLAEEKGKRRELRTVEKITGKVKILKVFSTNKTNILAGGRLEEGSCDLGKKFHIMHHGVVAGSGKIANLQAGKVNTEHIRDAGAEFGMMVETGSEISSGDILEIYEQITE